MMIDYINLYIVGNVSVYMKLIYVRIKF